MAQKVIYYQHRDWHLYRVELQEGDQSVHSCEYYVATSSCEYTQYIANNNESEEIVYTKYDQYYRYGKAETKLIDNTLFIHLYTKREKGIDIDSLDIEAESFYRIVEMKNEPYLTISSISEYLSYITAYSVVSLFANCQKVLKKYMDDLILLLDLEEDNVNKITDRYLDLQDLLNHIEKKQEYTLDLIKSHKIEHSALDETIKDYISYLNSKDINNQDITKTNGRKATTDSFPGTRLSGEAYRAIGNIVNRYLGNEYYMYYRGLGHIIYPEMPGVFRKNKRFEEDRMYKSMIMAFPKEFSGLKYLDRLSKLQHFELSTRLLDVSSNPLVALYMACNTIYTLDPKQMDWGEVVLYFMAGEKERAYDSKSVLINAALVKIPYSEKTTMYQFIRIHEVGFDCLCQMLEDAWETKPKGKCQDESILLAKKDAIVTRKTLTHILNRCVHLACDYDGVDVALPENEIETLRMLIGKVKNTVEEYTGAKIPDISKAKTASDFCWACMCFVKWPDNGRNWRGIGKDIQAVYKDKMNESDYRWLFMEVVKAYDALLIAIRRENPAFQNKINIFNLIKCYHGSIGMTNDRILAQSGSFIISGVDNMYISNKMLSSRSKGYVRMVIKNKKDISNQLGLLNITDATMLPDLTHKADYIMKQIKDKNEGL